MKLFRFALLLTVVLISALTGQVALAKTGIGSDTAPTGTTWYVAPTGDDVANDCLTTFTPCSTINGAFGKAADGDTILVASGTYTNSGAEVVAITKSITLSGGWNATFASQTAKSIIDGETIRRGITVEGHITVIIDNFNIQKGLANDGGGIYNHLGELIISNSLIRNNVSNNQGGGIYIFEGTLNIDNTVINANKARYYGGGISLRYNSIGTINNSTINGNAITASYMTGSGIHTMVSSLTIYNSTISGNKNYRAISISGSLGLYNSTVSSNSGTAVYLGDGTIEINNSTIVNNLAGIDVYSIGTVTLKNSILADNVIDCESSGTYGIFMSAGYNIIGNGDNCPITGITGDQIGTSTAPIYPMLSPLQDNGGSTLTHALLENSPALDTGNPAAPGSGNVTCLAADQRGNPRPVGNACDVGAYEGYITTVRSIKLANPNPSTRSAVNFIVSFAEPVTGVDVSDFTLTTNKLLNTSILSVTGTDAVYTVEVATGSGDGTVRLNVEDDNSILDTNGNPLGGIKIGDGNYSSIDSYTIWGNPRVTSIVRNSSNPSSSNIVKFKITFSEPVTGVEMTAPFSDFSLTTTGVRGASIASVFGSKRTYTVTVKTGTGNGTIRLNVVDDDSIVDAYGNPLQGSGVGNGDFKTGQKYKMLRIPTPKSPIGQTIYWKPPFEWTQIPAATKYQYQVKKGSNLLYTYTVGSAVCKNGICSHTPPKQFEESGNYTWNVRALRGGQWSNFSAFKSFKILLRPRAGLWAGATKFYVTPDRAHIENYTIVVTVSVCKIYNRKLIDKHVVPIVNYAFTHKDNGMYFGGSFNTEGSATTNFGLAGYYLPGCGYLYGGPFTALVDWKDSSQPTMDGANNPNLLTVVATVGKPLISSEHHSIPNLPIPK